MSALKSSSESNRAKAFEAVREPDAILREEFAKAGLNKTVWQYFTAIPDFKSVGVKDGKRTDAWPVINRVVHDFTPKPTGTIEWE